jgi:nicotinamidase-related amidase
MLLLDFINPSDFPDAERLAPRWLRAARRTAALKARATARRVVCIYVNDNFGNWTSEFATLARDCARRQTPAGEVARLLRPSAKDLSVLKPHQSAFYGTPLEFLLRRIGATRIVLTGVSADMCITATALDAHMRHFELWIPRDCVAAATASYERAALTHLQRTVEADVRSSRTRSVGI